MSDFFEDEAEVSEASSEEGSGSGSSGSMSGSEAGSDVSGGARRKKVKKKKEKKKKKILSDDEDDDEEEEIDEAAIAEEMKDFINEDDDVEEEVDEEEEGEGEKKRKHESEEEDDQLEDEDYDLIEENLGIKVQRAKKLKRIKRMISDDEDSEKEEETEGAAQERIANELFEGDDDVEDDDDDARSRMTRAETEARDLAVEGSDEEDELDDFIVDDQGQPISGRKKKRHIIHSDALLQEAQDIFGVDFDFDEFKDYGDEEEDEEEEDEYLDEDELEGEDGGERKVKKKRPKGGTKASSTYEPEALSRAFMTEQDSVIRSTDMPERFQLRQTPVKETEEGELEEEADWIYKQAFNSPPVSTQTFLDQESGGSYGYSKKGPSMVEKIKKAVDFMRNKHHEVPFIAFYRKECVEPDLNINDLWRVWHWDERWTQLRTRKQNLIRLFERMQNYQYEMNSDPDKVLESNVRTLTEEDIDRVKKVETMEELRDVYNHFLLYYGSDIPKMRNFEKVKRREERNEERGEDEPRDDDDDHDQVKQASRKSGYTICVKNKLDEIALRFGLTPEQFGENLRDNYQRHDVDQCPMEPLEMAADYIAGQFPTAEEVMLGSRHMVAMQLSHDPLVRQCVRAAYFERARIHVEPTKKGIKVIDEAHPCYSLKYLKNKPVHDLKDEQFLRLSDAEDDQILTIRISMDEETDNPNIQTYFEEIRQLYYRDEFSHLVQQWNIQRSQALERALTKILYPQMEKELRLKLIQEAKEGILKACCRKLYNWLKVAPYQAEQQMEDDYDFDDNESGVRVLGIAYINEKDTTSFGCMVNGEGEVTDYIRLPYLKNRTRTQREKEREEKEKDMEKLKEFIETKKPHVVAVTAENIDALMIVDDIKKVIAELEQEAQLPPISVELVDNELAMVYANSTRADEEFREYPPVLRHAVCVARRLQDPLIEFAQLCNQDEDILCLKYHPLQDSLAKEDLLNALYLEFVNRVNEVGVDVNRAITNSHTAVLVQFICGLGPRKGAALLRFLRQNSSRLENRTHLVTLCRMGPKVFINSAGFIKIDTNSLGDSTEAYVEVLDGSRVHPEYYEWARKMAVDALEYDDTAEDANPAGALEEILESPERLKDLDLDAFAEELERQGYGDKHITLYDIRAELNHRYKDLRTPYRSPTNEERFNMITKETPDTFYIGKLLMVRVTGIAHRKPHGEQLDQADPVRNEETGLWQCPFCNKNDFPELSEVWSHFDNGSCPGSAVGVRARLDNGCTGFIHIKNLSDKKVTDPLERVKVGMMVHSRIIKIDIDRFTVDLTTKSTDLLDKENQWKPQKDLHYDMDKEKNESEKEEEKKKIQARQAYIKRVIAHPNFHNIGYKECEKILSNMDQGECIIRPSSKGADHLTVTWKVAEGVLHHIDIKEEGKENAFSLGRSLLIGGEEFEDLDEIIARHIQPIASHARDIINFKNYLDSDGGKKEILEKKLYEDKKKAPSRIPYYLSSTKQYPGKFLLSYMPRTKPRHEYVTVTTEGFRYRHKSFHSINSMMRWFKEHFRDPLVGTPSNRTPMVGQTPNFSLQGVDAATIQRAAAGLPSNIYNTLAQVAGVTPAGVTPGVTPRVTPGFTPGFTPRTGFTPHTPQVGGSSSSNFAGGFSGGMNYRPQNPVGSTPMMTPAGQATPSYQPTPKSQWPGATPRTPRSSGQSTSGAKPGGSAGTDWAKAAEMWAKHKKMAPGTPRSPAVRPSPRRVEQSPAGDATPLFDER
ncbi:transcription elongation factor SPT6-like isoform X2 [Mercenaria mercenaria]|uniref:transcription elongation factor SPT6-like isoform X2 n=1 Tax=Mercenaria mercenaria TaxID=6596 RepID=UPI00234F3D8B|nr:transcription elongation factor SPT6-like isoform X2 [Mercenaria mercenaria]